MSSRSVDCGLACAGWCSIAGPSSRAFLFFASGKPVPHSLLSDHERSTDGPSSYARFVSFT